ncbi:hypothetical protein SLA2020_242100 [Shorea laevis]
MTSQVLGEAINTTTSILETATSAIQSFGAVNKIHQHLCAFHFNSNDMTRQLQHHFCAHQNEEMRRCLIYDSPRKDARLIGAGVPDLGEPVPDATREKEGTVALPRVGKGDNLPLGLPQLMMALIRDGQLYDELAKNAEKQLGTSLAEERGKPEYMKGQTHGIHPFANGGGRGLKTELRETECKPADSAPS